MADDQFHHASGNWWDSVRNNVRFESGAISQSSSSSGLTNLSCNFTWQQPTDMDDPRSSMDTHKLHPSDSASSSDPNLHMMGLGLSSHHPPMDNWNQASFLRGEKGVGSMVQENLSPSSTNFQQETGMGLCNQVEWRSEKLLFSGESSSPNDHHHQFKQVNMNRGFSLDQTQFSPQYSSGDNNSTVTTSQGLASTTFHMDSSSALYGLLGPDHNQTQQTSFENMNRSMHNFPYSAAAISYGSLVNSNDQLMPASWSKVPQFLRPSPPKQQPQNNQLHFTNNAPFWNASEAAIKDGRSSFFPSLQPPFPMPNFDVQSKNICGARETGGVVKKSGSETAAKRARNETPSSLPAFKVRKEKMGDRITALQQLVSPFGKTDTASVLSEAIEYIKFLHEQITLLSTPYLKSGAPIQHQQSCGKSKESEGPKQDLRSRGLCLVPVSSTFPVTHETTVDFWMPTFGATFR